MFYTYAMGNRADRASCQKDSWGDVMSDFLSQDIIIWLLTELVKECII